MNNVSEALRELGDDHGRPMPVTGRELLGKGKQVRQRRRVAGLMGATAALALAAVLGSLLGFGANPSEPVATASTVLDRAAAATGELVPGPDQYVLVSREGTIGQNLNGVLFSKTFRSRTWVPADRSGVWVRELYEGAPFTFASPADEDRLRRNGAEPSSETLYERVRGGRFQVDGGTLANRALDPQLPTEPEALLAYVGKRLPGTRPGPGADEFSYRAIMELLASEFPSSEVRAAAMRALNLIPGETAVVENVRVGDKTGLGISRTLRTTEPAPDVLDLTLVVDPSTYQIVGIKTAIRAADAPAGSGQDFSSTIQRSIVDDVPVEVVKKERAAARTRPISEPAS